MSTAAGIVLAAGYALWGAFWWRVRGGAWETLLRLPPGTTKARIATSVAIAAPLVPALGWLAVPAAAALFLGMSVAGWGKAMDIGRKGGSRLMEALTMAGWGLMVMAPSIVLAIVNGWTWWPMAAAGVAFGPIYALCWWIGDVRGLPRVRLLAAGPTEWAEVFVGAVIGAALGAALAAGSFDPSARR